MIPRTILCNQMLSKMKVSRELQGRRWSCRAEKNLGEKGTSNLSLARAKLYKCLSRDFRCKKEIMFVRKLLNITGPDNVHPLCVDIPSSAIRGANIDGCIAGSIFKSDTV